MASAERSEVPRELEETLRHRARDFIRDARARGRAWTEKELLDAFLEIWSPFSAAEADVALSLLLQSFLAEARENGTFVATIEGWTERLATDKRPCAGIILDAFYAEANASYAIALEERGAVWFDDYFPVIPKGDAFAMSSLPLFRECLFRYCEALAREGINDHLSYCWSNLSARFRRSPYLNEFCRHFELLTSSQLIGHYKLEQLVGIGGMGVVYRATHKDLHRVALKMMRPDCTCPDRFSQEVLRTVELDDPRRFVVIKDSDLRHTPPFFTMDFVESGKSLLDLLQNLRRGDPLVRALQKTMNAIDLGVSLGASENHET